MPERLEAEGVTVRGPQEERATLHFVPPTVVDRVVATPPDKCDYCAVGDGLCALHREAS